MLGYALILCWLEKSPFVPKVHFSLDLYLACFAVLRQTKHIAGPPTALLPCHLTYC